MFGWISKRQDRTNVIFGCISYSQIFACFLAKIPSMLENFMKHLRRLNSPLQLFWNKINHPAVRFSKPAASAILDRRKRFLFPPAKTIKGGEQSLRLQLLGVNSHDFKESIL